MPTPAPIQQQPQHHQRGRYWGRDFPQPYRHDWTRHHNHGYPYWYFRSFDYPLSYGYYPYPYSIWDAPTRRYLYDARYPYFQFYLSPGLTLGLPPLGFGIYYDLYWHPTERSYFYRPRYVGSTQQPVEAGLRVSRHDGAVRISWADSSGRRPNQVSLFIADSAQTVLAVQTVTASPYVVLFDPPPSTAFVGVSVEWSNGTISTALLPYAF